MADQACHLFLRFLISDYFKGDTVLAGVLLCYRIQLLAPSKTLSAMVFTDSGIVTDSSTEQLANAVAGMPVRLLPRFAVFKLEQPMNVPTPISVTESGSVISSRVASS